jgi:Zn-dependent peptidase ImmA (M78 family)/DNA-binding XRE family transcriptional regulator
MKGVDGFIGEMLTEARVARGINQSSLARIVEVSPAQISKYEKGEQNPSPLIFDKICSTLSMPSEYFLSPRNRELSQPSAIYYRSLSAATKQQRASAEKKYMWLIDLQRYLEEFIEFPPTNLPKDLIFPGSPELISNLDIERAAESTREFWGLGLAPISNLTRLLENNGVVITFTDLEADTLDAFSQFCNKKSFIVVSTRKFSAARVRFTLAHELGHLILHKNILPKSLNNKATFKLMEEQANRFAGAFLFPEASFLAEVSIPDLTTFKLRKPRWKMSIAAMIFRARNLGLIDEITESKLRRSYGQKQWSRLEPLDNEIEVDQPELLKDAFEMLINEKVKSKNEVLDALRLPGQDIEEIACLEPGFLKDNMVKLNIKRKVISMEEYQNTH